MSFSPAVLARAELLAEAHKLRILWDDWARQMRSLGNVLGQPGFGDGPGDYISGGQLLGWAYPEVGYLNNLALELANALDTTRSITERMNAFRALKMEDALVKP
jgi:hypothetical protein